MKHIKSLVIYIITAVIPIGLLQSCKDEETLQPYEEDSAAVTIGGKISASKDSRAYQANGTVNSGNYYLTYTSVSSGNQVAKVTFGNSASPSTGIVTTPDNDELKWVMVGGSGTVVMCLDNVEGNNGLWENNTEISFSDTYNPYKAAPFDSINGTNDLLWGTTEANRGVGKINFSLYHNMSRLRIIIKANTENNVNPEDLDLSEGATVTVTGLRQTPQTYNRLDGSLYFDEDNPEYSDLTLIDNTGDGDGEILDWVYKNPADEDNKIVTYVTPDFVLPPQILQDNDSRPRLVITTKGGKTFSGILPHAMLVEYEGQEEPYPVALAFLKQHRLTIETQITQDPPELVFMPVKVTDWVDKGEWVLDGHQAGIYSQQDFMALIEYFQNANLFQLARYGFADPSGNWTFNFWGFVTLNESAIAKSMATMPEGMESFQFIFNGYTPTLIKTDGTTEQISNIELYNLVTEGTLN